MVCYCLFQEKAKETLNFNFRAYQDEDLKRQFDKLTKLGYAALPDDKYMELQNAITAMETNYAKIKICSFADRTNCTLQLEPGEKLVSSLFNRENQFSCCISEIEKIFEESEDPEELQYYWEQWYNLAGTRTKPNFLTYVRLKNEAARLNSKFVGELICLPWKRSNFHSSLLSSFRFYRCCWVLVVRVRRQDIRTAIGKYFRSNSSALSTPARVCQI